MTTKHLNLSRRLLKSKEVGWNDISRGMKREVPQATDEAQMRAFWRQWNKLITNEKLKRQKLGGLTHEYNTSGN